MSDTPLISVRDLNKTYAVGEIEVRALADDGFVEAAFARMVIALIADVPLAEHACRVTGRLQRGRKDHAIERKICDVIHGTQRALAPVKAVDATNGIDSRARRVLPADRGSGGPDRHA